MLPTRAIPIYGDDTPGDWHVFLYKASKGSIKAADTVSSANMAYMISLTGDPTAPDTMHLDEYDAMIRERFPSTCPVTSIQHFHDLARDRGWISKPFRTSERQYHDPAAYVALWGRAPVAEFSLMNDAMLYCLDNWSPEHFIECVDHYSAEYDSRMVTAAMLYLSLTWPATEQSDDRKPE